MKGKRKVKKLKEKVKKSKRKFTFSLNWKFLI